MTSTFVAGLRHDGIAAPMLIDSPMTGRIFQQWLTDHLIPELPVGSIVVCDNLPAHKVPVSANAWRMAGMALRYLPPPAFAGAGFTARLQPDLAVFAQLKALRRRAAPRSFAAIVAALKLSSIASYPPNAPTISNTQDTCERDRARL